MRMLDWAVNRAVLPLMSLGLTGCYAPGADVALSPAVPIASVRTIAVCDLADGGDLEHSGAVATRALEAALLKRGFRLVPYARVVELAAVELGDNGRVWVERDLLEPALLARVREETGADALLVGAVTGSSLTDGAIPPYQIDCAFRLVATRTGDIVAAANATDDGSTLQSAAAQMAKRAVDKIPAR